MLASSLQAERIVMLKSFSFFESVEPELLAAYVRHSELKHYPPGAVVFEEGRPVDRVAMLVDGAVAVERQGHFVRTMEDRSSVGFLAMMAGLSDGLHARATRHSTILMVPGQVLLEVIEESFDATRRALSGLARRVIELRCQQPGAGFSSRPSPNPPKLRGLDVVERALHIRASMGIAEGRIDAILDLAAEADVLSHSSSHTLWSRNDACDALVILLEGVVDCATEAGTRFSFYPGDVLGGLDVMAGTGRWYEARARTPSRYLAMGRDAIFDVMEDNHSIPRALLRIYAASAEQMMLDGAVASAMKPAG